MTLESELSALLNRYNAENESDTPDFILAGFLRASLAAFNGAVNARENWYGHSGLTKLRLEKPNDD